MRQYMQQETSDELVGRQGHRFDLTAIPIILPLKADLIVFDVEQSVVGNRDAMRVAAHVIEDLLGAGEGALGIYDPFASLPSVQKLNESVSFTKRLPSVEELQFAGIERMLQRFEEDPAKQMG